MNIFNNVFNFVNLLLVKTIYAAPKPGGQVTLGFTPPTLVEILTFLIRFFFVIAGLAALLFLLMGALSWVTSGGDKENVKKAQEKIQAAVIGLVLVVVVLAIIVTLEQVVFNQKICIGVSCDITIPSLIK